MVWEGLGPYNDVSPAFENNQFGPRVHNTSKNTRTQKYENTKIQKYKNTKLKKYTNTPMHFLLYLKRPDMVIIRNLIDKIKIRMMSSYFLKIFVLL